MEEKTITFVEETGTTAEPEGVTITGDLDDEDEQSNHDLKMSLDAELLERVDILEDGVKTCRGRIDEFSQELKILLVEINIVSEWIKDKFGVELFDKEARIFKHIHDFDEVEELSNALSLVKTGIGEAQSRPRSKFKSDSEDDEDNDDDDEDEDGDNGEDEDEDGEEGEDDDSDEFVFDPPECVIHEQVTSEEEGEGRKRRATRKRINYSELAEGIRKKKVKKAGTGSSTNKKGKGKKRKPYKWRSKEEREQRKQEKLVPKKRGRPKKKPEERAQPNKDHPPMMCEECGKILKGPGSLKSHMDMHADRRPFPCPMEGCGKRFRVKNKLAIHMIIHKGEKTEQCRFCGRLFYFQKDLARHERTHTGEKPHGCPLCPKSFNVKQHLTLHIRTHTGERPYKCPTCEKTFSQANSLRIHKKIHLKTKGTMVNRKPRAPPKNKTILISTILPHPIAGSSQSQSSASSTNTISLSQDVKTPITVTLEQVNTPGAIITSQAQARQHHSTSSESRIIVQSPIQELVMDPVQQAWKLASEQPGGIPNSLGTVQFPIYGFETQQQQQHRHGIIIQNSSGVEQRMFPPPQFGMTDPNIRYFTGE